MATRAEGRDEGEWFLIDPGFPVEWWECSRIKWWLHSLINILKTTQLYLFLKGQFYGCKENMVANVCLMCMPIYIYTYIHLYIHSLALSTEMTHELWHPSSNEHT